ncbi:MAG: pacearchaeosortase [archaeon]
MNKQYKKILNIIIRYLSILILGLGNLYILQKILTPITIHTTNWILNIFTETILVTNTIHTSLLTLQIIPACVAVSAFYLLLFLIFSTADIKPKTRFYAASSAIAILFILNVTRILILIPIATTPYFDTIHWLFWHLISTVFVVATWFAIIKLYKIEGIPIYTDIKYLKSLIR